MQRSKKLAGQKLRSGPWSDSAYRQVRRILDAQLNITQKHSLTHQQYVSLQILTMNNNELNDYVNELMLSNPVVDLDQSGTSEKSVIISYDDARDEFNRRRNDSGSASDGADMLQTAGRIDVSLQSFLRMQIKDSLFTSREIKCLNRIIEHIDERGYLSETPQEMSALLHISESEYLKLLHAVQGLEPAGVAARDLSECLLLQLRRLDAEAPLAETIVRKYLAELGANKLPRIAQLCGVTVEEVAAARELIRSLRPSPVSDLVNVETGFIIPDIVVTETPGGFDLRIVGPTCVADPFYRDVVRGQSDSEARAYIDNCYREVRAVQHGIEQRNGTLLSISKLLLDRQRDFFLYGKPSLRTLRQSDISGALGLHESTVSRAIKDKSLQCRWGTFPLKYFFSVNLDGSSPQAQVDPRELIKRLIEEEPPSAPLSDQKLADEVCRRGIEISRRTVTKYRLGMGIGSAAQRKKY